MQSIYTRGGLITETSTPVIYQNKRLSGRNFTVSPSSGLWKKWLLICQSSTLLWSPHHLRVARFVGSFCWLVFFLILLTVIYWAEIDHDFYTLQLVTVTWHKRSVRFCNINLLQPLKLHCGLLIRCNFYCTFKLAGSKIKPALWLINESKHSHEKCT